MKLVIKNEADYVLHLCDILAEVVGNPPRLKTCRKEEETAAKELYSAGYKLKHLVGVFKFARTDAEWEGWFARMNSVGALADALLRPRDFSTGLEAQYEAWKAKHPPVCGHGLLLSMTCLRCKAKKDCPVCKGFGSAVVEVYIARLNGKYTRQVSCECVGAGTVAEQAAAIEAKENKA